MPRRRPSDDPISGLLIVNKPRGMTSHDVVDEARKLLRTRRIGHTGILDPNATGVLPLCVGRATRLAQFIIAESKTYEGVIRLGFATTTYDSAGEPTTPPVKPDVSRERLDREIAQFRGKIQQIPPMFSAKKVGGVKLYELAREGKEVERQPVDVEVFELEITSFDGERVGFRMRSSSGAYVRNVAHDLGKALGCGGHLETLNRTAVGNMTIDRAISLTGASPEAVRAAVIPMELIPLEMPLVKITRVGLTALRRGSGIDRSAILGTQGDVGEGCKFVRLADAEGRLVAIGERMAEMFFQPRVVLLGAS